VKKPVSTGKPKANQRMGRDSNSLKILRGFVSFARAVRQKRRALQLITKKSTKYPRKSSNWFYPQTHYPQTRCPAYSSSFSLSNLGTKLIENRDCCCKRMSEQDRFCHRRQENGEATPRFVATHSLSLHSFRLDEAHSRIRFRQLHRPGST
jgi:hypothetical protein